MIFVIADRNIFQLNFNDAFIVWKGVSIYFVIIIFRNQWHFFAVGGLFSTNKVINIFTKCHVFDLM